VIDHILSTIQALPGQVRGTLDDVETSLQRTRSELSKSTAARSFSDKERQEKGLPSLYDESVAKITSAPTIVADAIQDGYFANEKARADKAKGGGLLGGLADFFGVGDDSKKKLEPSGAFIKASAQNKPLTTADAGNKGGGGAPSPGDVAKDIKTRAEEVERLTELEKISLGEGIRRYQALVAEAQKAQLSGDDLYKVEKGLHDLREKMTKQQEKAADATDKLRIERLKLVQGETAGLLAALDVERKAREKAGADSVELEAWYGAQRQAIFKKDAEEKAKQAEKVAKIRDATADLKVEGLQAQDGKAEESALAALDQKKAEFLRGLKEQRDAIIREHGDRKAAEAAYQDAVLEADRTFQAQRTKIVADAAKARQKVEVDIKGKTLRNEASAETDPDRARKKTLEADNADRLQQIREQVEAYRQAGIDKTVVDRYIASEQKKIREEAKAAEKGEDAPGGEKASADPRKSFAQAFSGLSSLGFDLTSGGRRRRGDPAASAAASKLASDVGALRTAGAPTKDDMGVHSTLTIKVVNDQGQETFSDTVTQSKDASTDMSTGYDLGRFPAA
jgi:hypothetical protein